MDLNVASQEPTTIASANDDRRAANRELDRLHVVEIGLRAELVTGEIERARALRMAEQTLEELNAIREFWAHTQSRLDDERLARAGDRRARHQAEKQSDELRVALGVCEDDRARVDRERGHDRLHSEVREAALAACEADRDRILQQRDEALAEISAMRQTLSWKLTSPIRRVRGLFRR